MAVFAQTEPVDGNAVVLSTSGRTTCGYVQLWENGPKWATFNVGATITSYSRLVNGADATSFYNNKDKATTYNTANVGGLYPLECPNQNGRVTTWVTRTMGNPQDVATGAWGSKWKSPSYEQLRCLYDDEYTQRTWCDGVTTQYVPGCTLKGYKVSGLGSYADKHIFLPATGYFDTYAGSVYNASVKAQYWSYNLRSSDNAYCLVFDSLTSSMSYYPVVGGRAVRAVLVENNVVTEPQYVVDGSADVLATSGRTTCDYVQLWNNGPMWATFNVGATISDYTNLQVGADPTPLTSQVDAPYYNTANVGGLYPWRNPNANARYTTWNGVQTNVADVATTNWGSNWKTPSKSDLTSLMSSSYTVWIWCDGVNSQYVPGCTLSGYKVCGKGAFADRSIFLPETGYFQYSEERIYLSGRGSYWSSNAGSTYGYSVAYELSFSLYGSIDVKTDFDKNGIAVRAILDPTAIPSSLETTVSEKSAQKVIENNQLVIICDGIRYNAFGMRL